MGSIYYLQWLVRWRPDVLLLSASARNPRAALNLFKGDGILQPYKRLKDWDINEKNQRFIIDGLLKPPRSSFTKYNFAKSFKK